MYKASVGGGNGATRDPSIIGRVHRKCGPGALTPARVASVNEHEGNMKSHATGLETPVRQIVPILNSGHATDTFSSTRLQNPLFAIRSPSDFRMHEDKDASLTTRRSIQLVLEETADGWRATQHGETIEGTGSNAARAAEDYCRRVAERAEVSEPAESTEGSS